MGLCTRVRSKDLQEADLPLLMVPTPNARAKVGGALQGEATIYGLALRASFRIGPLLRSMSVVAEAKSPSSSIASQLLCQVGWNCTCATSCVSCLQAPSTTRPQTWPLCPWLCWHPRHAKCSKLRSCSRQLGAL
jgi:hypothetical protein